MAKLVIIPEDRLREILERVVRDVLSEGTSIDVDTATDRVARAAADTEASGNGDPRPMGKYVIGRQDDQYKYADVVALEVKEPVFSLDDAWEAIEDKILTDSKRARDSMRRSLDNDNRFERTHHDRDGVWFRNTEREQVEIET